MRPGKVFGSSLGKRSGQLVEVYERIHTGLGDGIMARPAIIANMKRYSDRRHVIHIYSGVAGIFEDIGGLEIVKIIEPRRMEDDDAAEYRYNLSSLMMRDYNISNTYRMSTPCAEYESFNAPYRTVERARKSIRLERFRDYLPRKFPIPVIYDKVTPIAIPTGEKIDKARQRIFCDTVGVKFSKDNYNVKFSDEELQIAGDIVGDEDGIVGIQYRTSTQARDYKYMLGLVDYVASKVNAVVLFDMKYRYEGRRSNVLSLVNAKTRDYWAVVSLVGLFIGPDSFGIHAAGSVGVPTYGIFGPTDPRCRLTGYVNSAWNDRWALPILRRGFKRGCGRQYCWYKPCKYRSCINTKEPAYYFHDAVEKLDWRY